MNRRSWEYFCFLIHGKHFSIHEETSTWVLTPNVPDIVVAPADDLHLGHVIDTMALHVLDDGCAFEQAIMEEDEGILYLASYFILNQKSTHTMSGGYTPSLSAFKRISHTLPLRSLPKF